MSKGLRLQRYHPDLRATWNDVTKQSVKPHFMFHRDFMDYHADRFPDASFLVELDGRFVAAIPGTVREDVYHTHLGLTFGGWLPVTCGMSAVQTLAATEMLMCELQQLGLREVIYKAIPAMYHLRPAEDDLYALFRLQAKSIAVEPTTAIRQRDRGRVGSRRLRGRKKADRLGCIYSRSHEWVTYWELLHERLSARHGVEPTHTAEEISRLANRWPDNIQLFTAVSPDRTLLAGVVMFLTPRVAHAQYIAANNGGLESGALDGLLEHLIGEFSPSHEWFDFGISSEQDGFVLNDGLIRQKEEFGGSTFVQTTYGLRL